MTQEPEPVPETERLILRPPRPDDAPALFAFMGSPDVMRHTHRHASVEALAHYLAVHEAQRATVGCAPWVLSEKAQDPTAHPIGFGGLYEDPFDPGWGVEVAYFLAPEVWGRGYAGELVAFCIAEARRLGLCETLRAFAHPDNAASQRVLTRAGFVAERYVEEMGRWVFGVAVGNRDDVGYRDWSRV